MSPALREVGRKHGLPSGSIRQLEPCPRIERGQTNISLDTIRACACELDLSLDDLIRDASPDRIPYCAARYFAGMSDAAGNEIYQVVYGRRFSARRINAKKAQGLMTA